MHKVTTPEKQSMI